MKCLLTACFRVQFVELVYMYCPCYDDGETKIQVFDRHNRDDLDV
jgi:hypothetical protein